MLPFCGGVFCLALVFTLLISATADSLAAQDPCEAAFPWVIPGGNQDGPDALAACITFLDSTPEASVEREAFRALLAEVKRRIDSSFNAMSRAEQRAVLAGLQEFPTSPGGILALAYAQYTAPLKRCGKRLM